MPSERPFIHASTILMTRSYVCNWYGVYDVSNAIAYPGHAAFSAKTLEPYKVNGRELGSFKTQDNLSFLRVYDAGHMVMYYREYILSNRCRVFD